MKTWRQKSRQVIGEAYLVWVDACGEKPSNKMSDEQKKRFLEYINAHYPFGQRKMFPYKMWLSEMRKLREWLYWKEQPIDIGLFAVPGVSSPGLLDKSGAERC